MIITGKKFSKPELSRVINGDKLAENAAKTTERQGVRLDKYLVSNYPQYNRADIQRWIKAGRVSINKTVVKKPSRVVAEADKVVFTPPKKDKEALPKLEVIYEDEKVLVVNKPKGLLSVSKGEYNPEPTLEDYGLIVHRLDRDTSGVVILAKDEATQSFLRKQFQNRTTRKVYKAVVVGHLEKEVALLDLPIARNYKRPTTFVVQAGGKPAKTQYEVARTSKHYTLLELRPTTGRTHQLRVHLRYIGHPILGDRVYGNTAANASMPEQVEARLYLHAWQLEITIPAEKEGKPNQRRVFVVPAPAEFEEVLRVDQQDEDD